jgi:co-chaperonin GroES (HSP10)
MSDTPIVNASGVRPLGHAILVKPDEATKASSIIEIPDTVKGRNAMVEQNATVIACGANAWYDENEPRAKPGDRVIITKYAGHMVVGPKDGVQYRLVNDRDIFAGLED